MRFSYLGLIVKELLGKKFSTFLTLFAISLGIMSIFVIFLLGQGFEDSITKSFEKFGSNRLYVMSATTQLGATTTLTKGLSDNELSLIENRPYVKKVYPYVTRNGEFKYGNEYKNALFIGGIFSQEYFDDSGLSLREGRIPKSNEKYSIMIGPTAAKDMFSKELRIGSNIYLKGTKFKVVGILNEIGSPQDDSQLYFNFDTVRELYEDGNKVGFMDVVIDENYNVDLAKENLQIILDNKLGKDVVTIIAPTQLLDQMSGILDIVKYTLGGIGFVALIVGALGIINTMYVIVTEKTRDIGIMKSIGARNMDILFMYMFQAGFFGLMGAILGVTIGSGIAKIFEFAMHSAGYTIITVAILPEYAIGLLIFGFLIGILSGFMPAKKASKINIIEAIRQ